MGENGEERREGEGRPVVKEEEKEEKRGKKEGNRETTGFLGGLEVESGWTEADGGRMRMEVILLSGCALGCGELRNSFCDRTRRGLTGAGRRAGEILQEMLPLHFSPFSPRRANIKVGKVSEGLGQ